MSKRLTRIRCKFLCQFSTGLCCFIGSRWSVGRRRICRNKSLPPYSKIRRETKRTNLQTIAARLFEIRKGVGDPALLWTAWPIRTAFATIRMWTTYHKPTCKYRLMWTRETKTLTCPRGSSSELSLRSCWKIKPFRKWLYFLFRFWYSIGWQDLCSISWIRSTYSETSRCFLFLSVPYKYKLSRRIRTFSKNRNIWTRGSSKITKLECSTNSGVFRRSSITSMQARIS